MISPENIVKAKKKKRIVIKVGTSSLTQPNGKVNIYFIDHLARQISDLSNRDMDVILVSSGAIGIGIPVNINRIIFLIGRHVLQLDRIF